MTVFQAMYLDYIFNVTDSQQQNSGKEFKMQILGHKLYLVVSY